MQTTQHETTIETQARQELSRIRAEMRELDEQAQALQQKTNLAAFDASALTEAQAELNAAKEKKRGLLARIWLGESKDSTDSVNQEIRDAEQRVDNCAESAQGAEMAGQIMQAKIAPIRQRIRELADQLPDLRYAIGVERLQELCNDYYAAIDAAEEAFVKARGAALAISQFAEQHKYRFPVVSSIYGATVIDMPWATTLPSCTRTMYTRNPFDRVKVEREEFGQYLANI